MIVGIGVSAVIVIGTLVSCMPRHKEIALVGAPAPHLFVFAGDADKAESDFLAVFDVAPNSPSRGEPLYSVSTGMKGSMPHHAEYVAPPAGEPLFMNAHHHEKSLIVDISDVSALTVNKVLSPPPSFRFPHDYARTESGTRLVGFLRSDGASPNAEEDLTPGNHGGIAEYAQSGELLRTASAAVDGLGKPVRPYAFAVLPDKDRFVVTSAPMIEQSWAEVLQIYRYSDFELLHTLNMPAGGDVVSRGNWSARATGFGAQVLDDGSVFLSTYECSLYHLTQIETDRPALEVVHTIDADRSGNASHACGIPVRMGNFWIQPLAKNRMVVVLDITDPKSPREVFRLETPDDFMPHWLSRDPRSNRLILGSEMGSEQGFYVLRIDESTGELAFDGDFNGLKPGMFFKSRTRGYISLYRQDWPHGSTGDAWGHAALFLNSPDGN